MSETTDSLPATVARPTTPSSAAPWLPRKGDKVESTRNGVTFSGKIFYADQLQVLVKWDNGSSSSLRVDKGELREIRPEIRSGGR